GDAYQVTAGVLAGGELRLDLSEELDVVVDVLGVLDLDPGPLGELLQRGTVLLVLADVHVLGPVGEADPLLRLGVVVRDRSSSLALRGRDAAGAQGGEAADGERAYTAGAEHRTAGEGAPAAGDAASHRRQLGCGQDVRLVLIHALCPFGMVPPVERRWAGYRSPKMVRCQSFRATAVLSYIT